MVKSNKDASLIKECRLCGSKEIKQVFNFGSVPLGNNLQVSYKLSSSASLFDLIVVNCKRCNHFQLSHSILPELLYATNYTYLSGIGLSFVEHIKKYVSWVDKKTKLSNKSSTVLDVGSNDGTCLKHFKDLGYAVCGVDPAQKAAEIANHNNIPTINDFFTEDVAQEILNKYGEVDLVTSQNVLAHVDNLKSIFDNIYKVLKIKGFFVFEIGYFKKVLETGCFDTIYHEHIDYHHANPLVNFLSKLGFDVLNISQNNIQGGSLRILLQKTGKGAINKQPLLFLNKEKKSILYNEKKLNFWYKNIEHNMKKLHDLFIKYKLTKDICYAYGAPTKATLLFKMSGLKNKDISFIVDDNKLKINRFMPISGIPIVHSNNIDFNKKALILLFAWNFSEDIIKKLKDQYQAPATIIIPLPLLKIVEI